MKLVASVATSFITQLISRHALSVISLEMYRILMFVLICGCWSLARCKCELFALYYSWCRCSSSAVFLHPPTMEENGRHRE